jgi:predicted transposase YbfD/YdcC
MFWNKLLLTTIPEVYITIDGIECAMDYVFRKYHLKHDRNMCTETKTNPRNLQNMIET